MDAQKRARVERVLRVRGLHHPDAFGEPIEQLEVVGLVAKQRLAKMNMGLHETRHDREARGVDRRPLRDFAGFEPYRGDAPSSIRRWPEDSSARVLREDLCVENPLRARVPGKCAHFFNRWSGVKAYGTSSSKLREVISPLRLAE